MSKKIKNIIFAIQSIYRSEDSTMNEINTNYDDIVPKITCNTIAMYET